MKKQVLLSLLFFIAVFNGCESPDPLEDLLQTKTRELAGVWIWINTEYPTPFGSIVVSSLESGTIYKVVFAGNKAEVFRQNHLVQKISFEVNKGSGEDFYLDILTKNELEHSSIDMLGGKILFNKKELTLAYDTRSFRSNMRLNKLEIF